MTALNSLLLALTVLFFVLTLCFYFRDRMHLRWAYTWKDKFCDTNSAALVLLRETARLNTRLAESVGENEFYKAASIGMRSAMDDMRKVIKANETFALDTEEEEAAYGD